MLFSVLHPTARVKPYPSFPDGWRDAMFDCFARCVDPSQVEYVISVHHSRWDAFWLGDLGAVTFPGWGKVTVVKNDGRDDNCTQANCAAAASCGQILIGTMDDLLFPRNWDVVLLDAFVMRLPEAHGTVEDQLDRELIVHCSTGSPRDWEPLINAGALTRKRYERFGYIAFPGYESMYLDNELTAVAYRDGVVIQRPDIEFTHNHPTMGKGQVDEIYALQNREAAYINGRALFIKRMAEGFPPPTQAELDAWRKSESLKAVKTDVPVLVPQPIRKSVLFVCPGDNFAGTWNAWFLDLFFCVMQRYATAPPFWPYSSNIYLVRSSALDLLLKIPNPPDYVLWLDSDQLLSFDAFELLMNDLEENPSVDMVAGWAWCRANDHKVDSMISAGRVVDGVPVPLTRRQLDAAPGDLVPIDYTGFPAVLMRYSMLPKVGPGAFAPRAVKWGWGFSGEDNSFSMAAVEKGCRLMVDRRVRVPHLKRSADDDTGMPSVETREAEVA